MKISVQKITLIAILTATSLIMFIVESQFPISSIGGIKLGLANVVTLLSMVFLGKKEAGLVLLLRIILATAFYGTFVSLAFSVVGGLFAYLIMCFLIDKFDRKQLWVVSVFGGVFHNFGQLLVAGFLTGSGAVVTIVPYLIISGILTGAFTGIVTQKLWFSPLRKYSQNK